MKKFFLSVLSSFTGTWLALCLFGIVAVIVSVAMLINIGSSSLSSGIVSTSDNSLLVLDLQGEIIEYTNNQAPDVMTVINGDFEQPKSLKTLLMVLSVALKTIMLKRCTSIVALFLQLLQHSTAFVKQSLISKAKVKRYMLMAKL